MTGRRTADERRLARKARALGGDLRHVLAELDRLDAERERCRFWCRLAAEPPAIGERTA